MKRLKKLGGFSLLELMIVMAISAAVMGVSMPMMGRMYDSMQYRDSVRSVISAAKGARFSSLNSGEIVDLILNPRTGEILIGAKLQGTLTESIKMEVISAREVNTDDGLAVIRFYPNGGSTGGDIKLEHESGRGLRIKIDWLFGRLSQLPLDEAVL